MWLLFVHFFDTVWDASKYARYGLIGLSHRGASEAEVIVVDERGVSGPHVAPVDRLVEEPLKVPRGSTVLAAPAGRSVALRTASGVELGVAIDGPCSLDQVAQEIASRVTVGDADELRSILEGVAGRLSGCTLAIVSSRGAFVLYRSGFGLRPLSVGAYGFDAMLAATESAAIELMGGRRRFDLEPGAILYGDREFVELEKLEEGSKRTCLYEFVYLARPDSIVDGVPVYTYRREAGRLLAKRHDVNVDVVVGVPETALPYALGYAEEKGARLELGFVSSVGKLRTGLMEDVWERSTLIHLKLNPVKGVFEGARVTIVDDSLVTGLTLKIVSRLLRLRHGAVEVHAAIASPLVNRSCPYTLLPWDESKLAAANVGVEKLRLVLEADSLAYLPLDDVKTLLARWGVEPCAACTLRG